MKNIFNKIQSKINSLTIRTKTAVAAAVDNTRAEGFVDTGVKIIIGVVIGGVILAGLYTLFNTTIMPNLSTEIGEMFNYGG